MDFTLRPYQEECLEECIKTNNGIVALATGLGKSIIMQELAKRTTGKVLMIAHRQELVEQNIEHIPHLKNVESISIQKLINIYKEKSPNEYEMIQLDEAHRYAESNKWGEAIAHFTPKSIYGFTATPNRTDNKPLDWLFNKIIYHKDIRFGIENGYLCRLTCETVDIGYDLSQVKKHLGDLAIGQLEEAVNIESANAAIKELFDKAAKPVIIFATGVAHAEALAETCNVPSVTGDTKERSRIIEDFKAGKYEGIINCQIFTEGINLSNAKTLIMARPTSSELLYIQIVGRILRLFTGKDSAHLIDCCGNVGRNDLISYPSLIGLDIDTTQNGDMVEIYGDLLLDIPELIEKESYTPDAFIKNRKVVDLFAKRNRLKLFSLNWVKMPTGELLLGLGDNQWIGINKIDCLKQTQIIMWNGKISDKRPVQEAINTIVGWVNRVHKDKAPIIKRGAMKWGDDSPSEKQKNFARRLLTQSGFGSYNINKLNKGQLSTVISRFKFQKEIKRCQKIEGKV